MNAFHFPLDKVLEWRRSSSKSPRRAISSNSPDWQNWTASAPTWKSAGMGAETDLRQRNNVRGWDLDAFDHFRARMKKEETRITSQREAAARKTAEQQQALMEAWRQCRLLERLRERPLADWKAARDRELEELASETFLAQWNRRPV